MPRRRVLPGSVLTGALLLSTAVLAGAAAPTGARAASSTPVFASLSQSPARDFSLFGATGEAAGIRDAYVFSSDTLRVEARTIRPLAVNDARGLALASHPALLMRDLSVSARLGASTLFNFASGRTLGAYDLRNLAGDIGGPEGLFLMGSALKSPHLALADGGTYGEFAFDLGDGLTLRLGNAFTDGAFLGSPDPAQSALSPGLAASLMPKHEVNTVAGSLAWNFSGWGGVALNASHTSEQNSVLGAPLGVTGASSLAQTSALGVSARVGFGDGWVTTMSYSAGLTDLNLARTGLPTAGDRFRSQTYGLAIAKHGVFGDDALGIAVSRPLQVFGAGTELADIARAHIDASPSALLGATRVQTFTLGAPESDIELGYVTSFMDGALALQANAGYQVNSGGQRGTDSVTGVARARINF